MDFCNITARDIPSRPRYSLLKALLSEPAYGLAYDVCREAYNHLRKLLSRYPAPRNNLEASFVQVAWNEYLQAKERFEPYE